MRLLFYTNIMKELYIYLGNRYSSIDQLKEQGSYKIILVPENCDDDTIKHSIYQTASLLGFNSSEITIYNEEEPL